MAQVNKLSKKAKMSLSDIIKLQLVIHCQLNNILVSDNEIECLVYFVLSKENDLTAFCNNAALNKVFSSPQSVRNCLAKLAKQSLIMKEGKNKKKVQLHPSIELLSEGNILLELNFLSIAES